MLCKSPYVSTQMDTAPKECEERLAKGLEPAVVAEQVRINNTKYADSE